MKEGIQPDIRKHEIETPWEYQEKAKHLYRVGELMGERFFNGLIYPDGRQVPPPVFAFEDLRNYRTLATCHLYPDEYGLMHRITMNTQHYIDVPQPDGTSKKMWSYGQVAEAETACHEYTHVWQQFGRGDDPYRPGSKVTHNREFVEKCNDLGLHPKLGPGYHIAPPDKESPFGILMRDLAIPWDVGEVIPDGKRAWFIIIDTDKRGERRKGTSTLTKYECSSCKLAVRVGVKEDPNIIHEPCNAKFVIAERRVR